MNLATTAERHIHRAAHLAESSPWLSVLSHVPVLGDQVRGVRDLTTTVDRIGTLGVSVADDAQAALDHASQGGPGGRIVMVDQLVATIDRLQDGLRAIDVPEKGALVAPLSGLRDDVRHKIDKAVTKLDDARRTLQSLRGFLAGPRRYLVLGGNNAEMRSVGIATTSGIATITDGAVNVGDFVESGVTAIEKPGVALPDGWDWLFGYLDPGIAYSNVVVSPNFDRSGDVASRIAAANRFGAVDGVIYVDTVALQGLLGVLGPVTVDGVMYDQSNVARILLNENYLSFSSSDPRARRSAQGRVASAIFEALNTRPVPFVKLAVTLQHLANTRHVSAWSSNAGEELMWHQVGADGVRADNDLLVAAEELGASKLDFYVTEAVRMTVTPVVGGRRVHLSIDLTNPRRRQTSPYIEGGTIFAKPGEYGVYLVVYMPRRAFDVDHPDPTWTSAATDGPLQATTFTMRIPEGTTRTVDMSFVLPDDVGNITVVPSGRLRPVQWTYYKTQFGDAAGPQSIDLRGAPGPPLPTPGWAIVGLLLFAVGAAMTGDAWGRNATTTTTEHARLVRVDAVLGWWVTIVGIAMIAAQISIYVRI